MAVNFPTSLDSYATLVDNTDDVLAAHANDRGDAIEALEAKVGIDSSAVVTSIDYFLKHASGAYRTHTHDGTSDDGALLDWDTCWTDAVHSHASAGEGGQLDWDTCWVDAVHDHSSAAEGGTSLSSITVLTIANNVDVGNFQIRALQFYSDAITGTAPLVIDSTTLVSNLNADLLDGQEGGYYTNASNLASGTVPTARLGSGSASSATFLRGDQSWAAMSDTNDFDRVAQTTLAGDVNTFTISSLSPGKRYKLIIHVTSSGNNGRLYVHFNGDSGSNYKWVNDGAATSGQDMYLYASAAKDGLPIFFDLNFTTTSDSTIVGMWGIGSYTTTSGVVITAVLFSGIYDGASNLSSITVVTTDGNLTGTATLYEMI